MFGAYFNVLTNLRDVAEEAFKEQASGLALCGVAWGLQDSGAGVVSRVVPLSPSHAHPHPMSPALQRPPSSRDMGAREAMGSGDRSCQDRGCCVITFITNIFSVLFLK